MAVGFPRLGMAIAISLSVVATSSVACDLEDYVGYSVIYSGTITGYYDDDGTGDDDFEGCDWGRKLILDDSKVVTCTGYSYSYAYRPDVVILSNGGSRMVACIDGDEYDVRR